MSSEQRRGGRPAAGEPVLDRAFRILDAFTDDHPGLRLGELAERTGMPVSTTLRLAQRLVRLGALERRSDGVFTMGLRMLTYAALAPRGHGLRAIALPYMEDLHRATGQHVQFVVREGFEGVIVERLSAKDAVKALYNPGARIPLHGTGAGSALLAHARPEFIAAYLENPPDLEPGSPVVDAAELRERITASRRLGYVRMQRTRPDAATVAAPVFDRAGVCIAALSVVGEVGSAEMEAAVPTVVAVARAISREMARVAPGPQG